MVIANLKEMVDTAVTTNVAVQETLEAKQEVIDKVEEAQGLVDNLNQSVAIKKQEIVVLTETKKQEIVDEGEVQTEFVRDVGEEVIQEFDEHALHRVNQYDANHNDKLNVYNINDTIKMAQYNENHIERLENINYAYADRIVDLLNTKKTLGVVDEYTAKEPTKYAYFLNTTDPEYLYYLNGVRIDEGIDFVVKDDKTIELVQPIEAYDVILQIDLTLLGQILINEQVLTESMKGIPNGVASLDENALVPASQLPSYVDDVIEVPTYADLPVEGEPHKIYVVVEDETSNNDTSTYRWTGTTYAMVSNTLNEADVKALYEANADTNAYTDAEKTFLGAVTALTTTAQTLPTAINELQEHVLSDGSDHAFIDQDVTTTGTPRFNSIQLNGGTGTQGLVSWNSDEETLDVVLDGAVLQVGQEFVVNVRNDTASLIENGTPVMLTSTLGNSGRVLVKPMDGTVQSNSMRVVGVTTVEIGAGLDGKATILGKIRDMDTTGASVGETWQNNDVLYVHPTQVGKFTKVAPTSSQIDMPIAVVVNAHTSGTLFVRAIPHNRNEISPAIIDNYYDKGAVDALLAAQNEASEITVTPKGNLSAETVQLALEELQENIDILTSIEEW